MPALAVVIALQAFKASLGDKAAGVSEDMIDMLAGQQMVSGERAHNRLFLDYFW